MPPGTLRPEQLPEHVRRDPLRYAEVRLYDALRLHLGSSWCVWYSVSWLGPKFLNGPPQDGEADFIIAHPEKGILVLEVKGGGVSYDATSQHWYSTDGQRTVHEIQDPFKQAMRNKHVLLGKLQSLPQLQGTWVNIYHGVAFPHIPYTKAVAPDALPEIVIDSDDLTSLLSRINAIFNYWQPEPWKDGKRVIQALVPLLGQSMTIISPLKVAASEEDDYITRLTLSQFNILDVLSRQRRAAIGGCAGSGKTFLAVEKAKRLAAEGYRTLLTCFNVPLASHLKQVTEGTPNLTVQHFHALVRELAKRAGVPLQRQDRNSDAYPEALSQAVASLPDIRYDAILVDEGQDFKEIWWVALEDCLMSGKQSVFYIFYDSHQTLYKGGMALPSDLPQFSLPDNVRNTQAVFQAVSYHYQGDPRPKAIGPAGRTLECYPYKSEAELKTLLSKTLNRLLTSEGFKPSDIIVLTPNAETASALPQMQLSPPLKLVSPGKVAQSGMNVSLETIHSFKGLEASVAVIAELDDAFLRRDNHEELAYIAFSRPRNHLILLGTEGALASLLPSR